MPVRSLCRAACVAVAALAQISGCTMTRNAVLTVEDLAEDTRARLGCCEEDVVGVGILGTVLGAKPGAIEVNGMTVATAPDTLLSGGFAAPGPLGGETIPPGHVVEIAAERQAGRLVAREIEPIFALAGPIAAVEPGEQRLVVMDTQVLVPPEALLPPGGLAALRPGQRVAVSGLWLGETLVASRIDPRTQKGVADAVVSGVVSPLPGALYRIGGVPLAAELGALRPGYFHVVTGDWIAGALLVDEIRLGRRVISRWPADRLVVEGYGRVRDFAGFHSGYPGPNRGGYFAGVTRVAYEGKIGPDPAWRDWFVDVGGLGRPLDPREDEVAAVGDVRALFVGPHDGPWGGEDEGRIRGDYEDSFDGVFDVDYIIPLPERLDHRLAALAAVGDPLDPATGAMDID
ncbi:MAG TPA: DUF5666 domain-containing protein [Thermohalobaculum sp.]|nr:DUF5666 domain-containing protein [Thermohalobaculum sp.]